MRSVVTGGNGFIGHHLVDLLVARDHRVTVLDVNHASAPLAEVEYMHASILDRAAVDAAFERADFVFHLAADPNLWARERDHFYKINYEGTVSVIEAAARARVSRLVHTSTESILKGARKGSESLTDEATHRSLDDMPGPYCRSKFMAEQAALAAAARGQPVVVVNPTLPIGPGDHNLTPPSQMLLDFVNGSNPAYLDFETNMIDVRDAAMGHLLAAEHGALGERYILGAKNVRLSEVLAELEGLTGLNMPKTKIPYWFALAVAAVSELTADHITRRPPRASLTGVRIAGAGMKFDCTKAARELGLAPRSIRESLLDGLRDMLARGLVSREMTLASDV